MSATRPSLVPPRRLPEQPNLEQLRKQAKDLAAANPSLTLSEAQRDLARSYGFDSWPKLKAFVDGANVARFAAAVQAGDIEAVRSLLRSRPELAGIDMAADDEHRALHFAVMRRDHALARRSFVRPADLVAHKLIATPAGAMREDLEHAFHSEGVELHPQYTANCVDHGCRLLLRINAIMIIDPLVPLAIDPKSFALVPLKPLRVVQSSIVTPALKPESRLTAEFKACLREEADSVEKRLALLLGSGAARKAPRRSGRNAR